MEEESPRTLLVITSFSSNLILHCCLVWDGAGAPSVGGTGRRGSQLGGDPPDIAGEAGWLPPLRKRILPANVKRDPLKPPT